MNRPGDSRAWWRSLDPLTLVWLVATIVVWGARGFSSAMNRDAAFYLYAGQQVAAGNAPYVEVMNRAGPYANLVPGLGVELGRLLGTTDVLGVRLLFFALTVTTPAIIYLTARDAFRSRLAGCAAAATLLGFHVMARLSTSGPESKLLMVTGLCVTLLLLVRRRWLLAGVATALVTLTWQPVFFSLAPAAAVILLIGGDSLRDRVSAAARYGVGGLLTLGVTVGGFVLAGATQAFVEGFWAANAGYTTQPGIVDRPMLVWDGLESAFGWGVWLIPAGSLALLALGVAGVWLRRTAPRRAADQALLAVSTLGGLVWCAFSFNKAPDSLLVLPGAALGVGGMVGLLAHWIRRTSSPYPSRVMVGATASWVAVSIVTGFLFTLSDRSTTLAGQQAASDALYDNLPEDATTFTVGVPQPLALSRRKSISRYVLFGNGMDAYVDAQTPGGLPAYIDGLIAAEPDVVLLPIDAGDDLVGRLMTDYRGVGFGPGWRVFLHVDVDPDVREAVAAALDAGRAARKAR